MEKLRYRDGDMEMKIWRYGNRDGDGDIAEMEMEIWILRRRYGY